MKDRGQVAIILLYTEVALANSLRVSVCLNQLMIRIMPMMELIVSLMALLVQFNYL